MGNETFDPNGSANKTMNLAGIVMDWLVGITADGNDLGQVSGLATKWEQSADGSNWTFTLRKGAKWDKNFGEATADDVKFSLDRTIFGQGSLAQNSAYLKGMIKEIQVVDPYTVKIMSTSPTLPWDLSRLGGMEGIVYSKKAFEQMGDKAFANNPVASGPYRVAQFEPGNYYRFEAREDNWAGAPKYKELFLYKITDDSTRIAMLKRGELDVAEVTITQLKEAEQAGLRTMEKKGTNELVVFYMNQWEQALNKEDVRKAINYAINKQELLSTVFEGRGQILGGNMPTWLVDGKPIPPYPYDPAKAKQLLAQAGYASGLNIDVYAVQRSPLPLVSEAVAGYLQAVGITAKVIPMDSAAWLAKYQKGEQPNGITPFNTGNRLFFLAQWRNQYTKAGKARLLYGDDKFDDMVTQAEKSTTMKELSSQMVNIAQYLYDHAHMGYLLEYGEWYAAGKNVNVDGWNGGGKAAFQQGFWQLAGLK